MSNHYHVVVCINKSRADQWSDEEVVRRWKHVFSVPDQIDMDRIALLRERLSCLSWYMRCINEPLARRANRDDDCTGHFWESRFKCQALLDEIALLKCMAYVDLNPIRAAVVKSPGDSDHTSIKARIFGFDSHLRPCSDQVRDGEESVPIQYRDYMALIEWTGGEFATGRRGQNSVPPTAQLQRMSVDELDWLVDIRHYGSRYFRAVGSVESLCKYCQHLGQRWLRAPSIPGHRGTSAQYLRSPLPG